MDRPSYQFLFSEAKAADQRLVTWCVLALQIIQQTAALVNKFQKTTTRVIIFLVLFEVFSQVCNTL